MGVYHLEGCVSSGGGLYHLEGCVSSGRGRYHLEQESIIGRGIYHLEGEGIIWSRRVSSGDVCIIWKGWEVGIILSRKVSS
jgi:hypothetical protein